MQSELEAFLAAERSPARIALSLTWRAALELTGLDLDFTSSGLADVLQI